MNTICNCLTMPVQCWFRGVFSYLNFTLITIDNVYRSQRVSLINRNETLTVMSSHSAETVEFRYGFKVLRLASRFQSLTVSVTVSHFFMPASCETGCKLSFIVFKWIDIRDIKAVCVAQPSNHIFACFYQRNMLVKLKRFTTKLVRIRSF